MDMKTRSTRSLTCAVVVAAVLAACGGDDDADAPVDPEPSADVTDGSEATTGDIEGSWRAIAGTVDDTPVELVEGWDVTFDVDGGQVGGTAACNGYGGSVDVGDGTIAIGELSWTEMGCEPAVMDLEQAFLQSLAGLDAWSLDGDRLTLTGGSASWTFERLDPVPTAELIDTTWVLDTVIDGDAATNSPGMADATLLLADDGTVTGSTGCRLLEGTWIESGSEIVFTEFAALDDPAAGACSPDAEELDGRIVSVLGDGFTADIDGDRLTVMSRGGEGLSYRADDES